MAKRVSLTTKLSISALSLALIGISIQQGFSIAQASDTEYEFHTARAFFVISYLIILVTAILIWRQRRYGMLGYVLVFFTGGTLALGLVLAMRFVDRKRDTKWRTAQASTLTDSAKVYDPFRPLYNTYKERLGNPRADAEPQRFVYHARHQHGIVIWFDVRNVFLPAESHNWTVGTGS